MKSQTNADICTEQRAMKCDKEYSMNNCKEHMPF